MRNAWLTEIRIRKAIEELTHDLNDKYLGTRADIDKWQVEVRKFLNKYYAGDSQVADCVMWKYTFRYEELDGLVKKIELVKLPWLI